MEKAINRFLFFIAISSLLSVSCQKRFENEMPEEVQFLVGTWKWEETRYRYIDISDGSWDMDTIPAHDFLDEYYVDISENGRIDYRKNDIVIESHFVEFTGEVIDRDYGFGPMKGYLFDEFYSEDRLGIETTIDLEYIVLKDLPVYTNVYLSDSSRRNFYSKIN